MGSLLILAILVIGVLVVGSIVMNVVFGLLGWLLVGLLAGFLANAFMKSSGGTLVNNLVLGVLGSLLSGLLLNIIGWGRVDNNFIGSIIFSTLGAMLLIGLGRLFTPAQKPNLPRY